MGLLAIVVNGPLGGKAVLVPKPKSICIAPSVAVGCGVSSSKLSIFGSKLVSELHSRGFVIFCVNAEVDEDAGVTGDKEEEDDEKSGD